MTGHTRRGRPLTGTSHLRNKQIRDYCLANNKILYDFADIESYDPDGDYFGDKLVNDACDYDSNGDGTGQQLGHRHGRTPIPASGIGCDVGPHPAAQRQPEGLRRLAPVGAAGRLGRELIPVLRP
ncbi:MAG: hypothetical protein MZU84_08235 [Sphingobacterium sp.]|nr:hypothetical protein [Sphingobacterium sp.]